MKHSRTTVFAALLIFFPTITFAQTIQNPLQVTSIVEFFRVLLSILLIFAVPIIVFFIVYAGFLYVTARGNTETISRAHKALLYAVIGGLLVLGANVLITVIQGTVNAVQQSSPSGFLDTGSPTELVHRPELLQRHYH